MKGGALLVMVFLAIFQLAVQHGVHAVTCGDVDVALVPCVNYLTGHADNPSPECCSGVKAVKGMGQTAADKRTCCGCVKAAANRYSADLKDGAAQSLPVKCGVELDIPISASVDCDKDQL
ncbi:hypothetical protein OROGR_021037 [Orobanche gracilis]